FSLSVGWAPRMKWPRSQHFSARPKPHSLRVPPMTLMAVSCLCDERVAMSRDRALAHCLDIADLREAARRRAHRMVFDYIDGGADDERTLARNCDAFADYELLFRVLVGVDAIDSSTTVLGHQIAYPFFPAPAAGNRLFHTEGERAVAKTAGEAGLIY